MKHYALNSPEAMARILAMMIITDADVHPHEIELLDELNIYDVIGISRESFTQVFHDYLGDLSDEMDAEGHVQLVSSARLDEMLDCVTDPKKRLLTAAILLDISKSDHDLSEVEIAVFQHILAHWHITLDDIQSAMSEL
ncbi:MULTISPECIES: hypothetical protein [Leeia]|uniref:Co-chaperone DjlA N-terminal domain-containing protein n=1 Tax=Leeia aquatica TaxID=2725557 RepID=A0A847S7P0_9NEIS|nr:hypothetical protein [Leeia aquatica]NLR75783.1 hypothetical protein [Leeia aquatica]